MQNQHSESISSSSDGGIACVEIGVRPPICGQRYAQVLKSREHPLTDTDVSLLADVSRNTLRKIRKNVPVREGCIAAICKALDIKRTDLEVHPEDVEEVDYILPPPSGWSLEKVLSPMIRVDNGIHFRLAKLKNKALGIKFARGKLYDLLDVEPDRRSTKYDQLRRHAEVCELIRHTEGVERLALNFDLKPFKDDCAWWVLDQWIDGPTLTTLLADNVIRGDLKRVVTIGREILKALGVLHSAGIIMRELTPDHIYVNGDRITVTDFELAKLVSGSITVRGDWSSHSSYRAEEISDLHEFQQSDIYSWARIICCLLSGVPTTKVDAISSLSQFPEIQKLLGKCLHKSYGMRPSNVGEVLEVWDQWKV